MIRLLSTMLLTTTLCAMHASAQTVEMKFKPTGALDTLRFFEVQTLSLENTRPDAVKKLPDGVAAAEFGTLKLGPVEKQTSFTFVLVGGETPNPTIFVDANADGDLTNDPKPEWKVQTYTGNGGLALNRYQGSVQLQLPLGDKPRPGQVTFYRFDPADSARPAARNKLFYYRDYGYEGEVKLGQYPYKLYLSDDKTTCDFRGNRATPASGVKLYIDVNGNSHFDKATEAFDISQPFKIGTATYEIKNMSASGETFSIVPQEQPAPKKELSPSPPPQPAFPKAQIVKSDLLVGSSAITFKAKDLDGKEINFPGDYKGKIVLLDFWATWCGPCKNDVPNLVAAYQAHHEQGFEILGISLDQANGEKKLKDYIKDKNMSWPQVFDGKYWSAEVAVQYSIRSIPAAFLVDGDTGKILAARQALRGGGLETELDAALKKKKGTK